MLRPLAEMRRKCFKNKTRIIEKMDRKLIFDTNRLNQVTSEFTRLSIESDASFEIWTELPKDLQRSYYNNERLINPCEETFEQWKEKLPKRPNPLYSVALIENQIISSVYGAGLTYERTMNLWVTNSEHRKNGIGRLVLLNFIKYSFENNPNMAIKAWDITSQHVDNVLTGLGFQ